MSETKATRQQPAWA